METAPRVLRVLDTTLRDGDQSACGSFSLTDKLLIARGLDEAGVDVVEAGFPAASQAEADACDAIARECSRATVSVMCRAIPAEIRLAASSIARARRGMLHLTLPVSDLHIETRLGLTRSGLLDRARLALAVARDYAFELELGAEDATRADPSFLLEYCDIACEYGVRVINIADTVGFASPEGITGLIGSLRSALPPVRDGSVLLGIHAHDDMGLALANTLAAIRAGCSQAEVTVGGIGERSGNAALEELVANLLARPALYGASTAVRPESLRPLVDIVSRALSVAPSPFKAVVGTNSGSHASGMHQQGISRGAETYSSPGRRAIGDTGPRIALSAHSGAQGVIAFARDVAGIELSESRARAALTRIKRRAQSCGITEFLALLYADGTLKRPVWTLERIEVATAIDGSGAVRHTLSATVSPSPGSAPETRSAESASASLVEAARDLIRLLFKMNFSVRVFSITGYGDGTRAYVEASREAPQGAHEGAPGRVRVTERRGASSGALLVACLVDFANAEISEEARRGECERY